MAVLSGAPDRLTPDLPLPTERPLPMSESGGGHLHRQVYLSIKAGSEMHVGIRSSPNTKIELRIELPTSNEPGLDLSALEFSQFRCPAEKPGGTCGSSHCSLSPTCGGLIAVSPPAQAYGEGPLRKRVHLTDLTGRPGLPRPLPASPRLPAFGRLLGLFGRKRRASMADFGHAADRR